MDKLGAVVVSDLHAHNYKDFATILPDGTNSRLQDCLNALDQALELAAEKQYPFLFSGDMIHSRTLVDVSVMLGLSKILRKWAKEGMEIFIIPGNHDLYSKGDDRRSSLQVFSSIKGVVVADWGTWQSKTGLGIVGCGYGIDVFQEERVALARKFSMDCDAIIFLGHNFISGTKKGDGYMFEQGVEPKQLLEDYDFCNGFFFGHVHTHQEVVPNRIYVPGATLQRYFEDSGEFRGFLEVSIVKKGIEIKKNTPKGVPRFWKTDFVSDNGKIRCGTQGDPDIDFYRIRVQSKKELSLADSLAKQLSICHYVVEQDFLPEAQSKRRLDLGDKDVMDVSDTQIINKFVKTIKPKTKDVDSLIKIGMEYLKESNV